VEHYLQGVTLGHLSTQLAVSQGSLWAALHQLARRLCDVRLIITTVEVTPRRRAIVQVRAKCNHRVGSRSIDILRRWASQENLRKRLHTGRSTD